jgi:hypothetical protein
VKWLAQRTIYRDSVDLLLVRDIGPYREVGQPVQMLIKRQEAGEIIAEPTLSLPSDQGQSLMQALWDAGLRPADWSSPTGEINALRSHVGFAEHVAKTLLSKS